KKVDIDGLKRDRTPWTEKVEITSPGGTNGTIHHWIGAIFIPGVTVDQLTRWVQNYDAYKDFYKEVEQSKLESRLDPNTFSVFLRLTRTKSFVTAKFNTHHIVVYSRNGNGRASSKSVATNITQVKDGGTSSERELPLDDNDGYLWKLNSYWRFAE